MHSSPLNHTLLYTYRLSSSSGTVGRLNSSFSSRCIDFLIGLVWAVNGDLDSDLTTLNLLSVHLVDSLLLLLLRGEGDETEATSLTGLVAGLELLDHETRDWAKGDLGRRWLVSSKEFLELERESVLVLGLECKMQHTFSSVRS